MTDSLYLAAALTILALVNLPGVLSANTFSVLLFLGCGIGAVSLATLALL